MATWMTQQSRRNKRMAQRRRPNQQIWTAQDFPDLVQKEDDDMEKPKSKLEARMNFLGVAKQEILIEREEKVPDGWVKYVRYPGGFVSKRYGLQVNNDYLEYLDTLDVKMQANQFAQRHEYYKYLDNEVYQLNYKNSWESDSASSLGSSDDEYADDHSGESDDMYDDEYGDY